jgi:hypothetical protein
MTAAQMADLIAYIRRLGNEPGPSFTAGDRTFAIDLPPDSVQLSTMRSLRVYKWGLPGGIITIGQGAATDGSWLTTDEEIGNFLASYEKGALANSRIISVSPLQAGRFRGKLYRLGGAMERRVLVFGNTVFQISTTFKGGTGENDIYYALDTFEPAEPQRPNLVSLAAY